MITFKEYHDKEVLGVREKISLLKYPDIGEIDAKIDTGNEAYNVLHGVDIKDSGEQVTFKTVGNKEVTFPKKEIIKIHIGSGVKEDRPVIVVDFKMNGKEYKMFPFSVADRSQNTEPVLIGEPFLKWDNAVVDPNK